MFVIRVVPIYSLCNFTQNSSKTQKV
uniref:Uncharacterized protein n=1 Tax=Anguilla anguilla TaxID=7936 RepID=A0A0E9T672_ANGAN